MELKDTTKWMTSSDYKERFRAEYFQTKIRYEKLKTFCNKIEAAQIMNRAAKVRSEKVSITEFEVMKEPEHTCPLELLREQQSQMGQYLHTLEIRAEIEQISLQPTVEILPLTASKTKTKETN